VYSRDLERLVRTFIGQKLDRDYIKHYLVETYQLDLKTADEIINKVAPQVMTRSGRQAAPAAKSEGINPPPIKRQKFY
jgi:hypothetical protein